MANFFVVDNEPMLHELYQYILQIKGHEVTGKAYNGNECLERIFSENDNPGVDPDYVIMDHRMPLKNGLDTTKELLDKKPDLKIVFVSADITVRDDALAAGAVSFIKKPFNIQSFFESIEQL
jgi:two-component system chemotaxis response regulator CheY